MSWYKNLKIRAKMIIAFSLVIVLLAVLAVFAITQLNTVAYKYDYAIHHPIEAEIQMRLFDVAVGDLRRCVTTMALFSYNNDASLVDPYNAQSGEAYSRGLVALAAFDVSLKTGTMAKDALDRTLKQVDDIRTLFTQYKEEVSDPVAAQSRVGNTTAAMQFIGTGVGIASDLSERINALLTVTESSSNANVAEAESTAAQTTWVLIIVAVVAAFLSVVIALYISSLISRPLVPLAGFMSKAGTTGDIILQPEDVEVIGKYEHLKDEIGMAIHGCSTFIKHVTRIAEELETVADGDLTVDIDLLSDKDMMGVSLRNMVNNLNTMFKEINDSTSHVSSGSKQVADGAQALAQGSTEQAASIQELSSSIAEIAEKTKRNADTADKTAKLAESIIGNAEKGSQQMDEMMSAVQDINQASQNISKVIKVIDDIAFQTNILALNAAVEAARAGQHGKGFAVVAEEVRNLASKSAEAAKETGSMIENSIEKAELGSRIAGETASSLMEIVTGINESSDFIREIATASEEQSMGISQINTGIDQVAQVVQQNSATAEESAAASEEMSSQSAMLEDLIARFKLKESEGRIGLPSAQSSKTRFAAKEDPVYSVPSGGSDFGKY